MRRLKNISGLMIALSMAVVITFTGCSDSSSGSDSGTGTMEVLLHDAPASFDEVNVLIERVEVNNAEDDTGWTVINEPQQSFDLIKLTNGATAVLGSKELPAGTYPQIRLILSDGGHSVVIDGNSHNMVVPSGAQTGIKLNINAEVEPDITYTLLLDFDASRSVVVRGNEQAGESYLLKPVVSATNEAVTGNISGTVDPAEAEPNVFALSGSDTLSSTVADTSSGEFTLIGLGEGSYTVSIDPTNTTYQAEDTTGIEVTAGETNDIGTIVLSQ